MDIRSVELRDWRSYRHARFEFPRAAPGKNVILVMAPNEHGKTSLFEAITLCLFGREGITLIPRARTATGMSSADRLNMTYSQFLANTLHRRAIESGRSSCSVTVTFEDNEGDPVELTRKWHFRPDGSHKLNDDQLTIYEGQGRVPVTPPLTEENRDSWYRDYVSRRFLQPNLAEFFLFDGEQVQRYATKEMAEQVRLGIEGLLGLPILKRLRESLIRYAEARRSGAAAPSDLVVKQVEADIAELAAQQQQQQRIRDEAAQLIPSLQQETDLLTQQLGGRGEGTVALVADLVRDEERFRADAARANEALVRLLAEDVALGVAGVDLRRATKAQLDAEAKRERWETGRNEGNLNLDRFTRDLGERLKQTDLSLSEAERTSIVAVVKDAWDALWHPAPEGCANDYLHTALMGATRAQAIARLDAIDRRSRHELGDLVARFRHAVETADSKQRERLELEQSAPEAERLSRRLREASTELGKLQGERETAERALTAIDQQLANKRQEFGRHVERIGRGAPALRRAQRADQFVQLIDRLVLEAVPSEVGEVASEMTKAWKSMAHLSDRVERIVITPDCEVQMLNKKGEDLHLIDKSAGASQVFTQALITAITKVSQRSFPFIVDTPLARLSRDQRIGVLKTFTDRDGQVMLLSTDEEVVGDKLEAIQDRVAAAFRLDLSFDNGVAVTSVHPASLDEFR